MKTWEINNLEIREVEFDYDLHNLNVYLNGKILGTIYPSNLKAMEEIFADLDNGHDPINEGWEDGRGNTCTIEGWGQ